MQNLLVFPSEKVKNLLLTPLKNVKKSPNIPRKM